MRPVRILLVAIAVIAVGLAGWAIGARGAATREPDDTATATTARPERARGRPGPRSRPGAPGS